MPSMETRMIVLSEDSIITAEQLLVSTHSCGESIHTKGTCYGLLIQGEKEAVKRVIKVLRRKYPYSIFSKERGFGIGDKRRCRVGEEGGVSGGPRPGFFQLEIESQMLPMIGKALEAIDNGEEVKVFKPEEPMDEATLERIVREILASE